jgi:hypothetical protein
MPKTTAQSFPVTGLTDASFRPFGSKMSLELPADLGIPDGKYSAFPGRGQGSLDFAPDDNGRVTVRNGMAVLDANPFAGPGLNSRQMDSADLEKRINAVETSSRNELIGTVGVAVLGGAIQYLLAVRNEKSQMKLWEKQYDAQLEMLALQTEAYENERGGGGGGGGARASITRGIYGGKS